jgi:hypothetical protein
LLKNRFMLVAALLFLAPALVLSACGGKKKSEGTSAAPTQASGSATQAPSSSSGGGSNVSTDELKALVANFVKVKSFRMVLQDGSGNQQGTIEYVAPDKYHINVSGLEVITIGKDNYLKQGGTWTKLPSSQSATPLFDASTIKQELDSLDVTKYTKGGTDTVNGTKCQLYTVTESDGTKTELCVANGLPLRIKTSGTIVLISDYDKVGDIKAPI